MKIEAIPQVTGGDQETLSIPWLMLHCLGFGACSAWVHVGFFSSVLLGDVVGVGLSAWLANLAANGLAMIAGGLLAPKMGPLAKRPTFCWAAGFLVAASTFVTAYLYGVLPDAAWMALGPALAGMGTACLLLLWAEAYQEIDSFVAKKYTLPGAMTAGVIIYLLVTALSSCAAVIATAALPVLSVVCLKSTYATAGNGSSPAPSLGRPRVSQKKAVVKFMLIISVYCLASGFMSGRSTSYIDGETAAAGTAMFGGIAVLMIAIAVLSIAFVKPDREDFAYRMIVPLMAAGLLIMPFMGNAASAAADIAIMGGYIILEIFAWSTLQDISREATEPPATVFGIGKSGMNLGLIVGCAMGIFASSQSTMIVVGISVFIVYVFILLGALSPREQQAGLVPPLRSMQTTATQTNTEATPAIASQDVTAALQKARRDKCRDLAERFALSQREEEVLCLLSYGRNLDAIAETLSIAQSTVRSHRDHIYRKLGIHNRQELLDLMDAQ